MNIINFGSCNIDYVYKLNHIVKSGETTGSTGRSIFPGGKGLNQSLAIARSGIRVYHVGCIGNDGVFLKELLNDSGVDVTYINESDISTGHAIIQVDDNGENAIILYPGANHTVGEDIADSVLNKFCEGDIVVLQNEINNIEYIIDKAYEKGMKIILNPSPFHKNLLNIDLNKIFALILNEVEAFEFSKEEIREKKLSYFKEKYDNLRIVLTLGSNGSIYSYRDEQYFYPAYSVEAVDTTAAGDTFTGYFISGLVRGMDCREILKYASAASALAVSKQGAAVSIPYNDDVKEALKTLKLRDSGSYLTEQKKEYIRQYILNNHAGANLDELAKKSGYCKSHMTVWIKKHMGTTFSRLVQEVKCDKAAQMLRETDLSINEIIKLCGYENGNYFRKIFCKRFGKMPFEYRSFYKERANIPLNNDLST